MQIQKPLHILRVARKNTMNMRIEVVRNVFSETQNSFLINNLFFSKIANRNLNNQDFSNLLSSFAEDDAFKLQTFCPRWTSYIDPC